MKLPPEEVYRAAGLLPRKDTKEQWIDRATYLLGLLPPEEQERWVNLIEAAAAIEERRKRGPDSPGHAET